MEVNDAKTVLVWPCMKCCVVMLLMACVALSAYAPSAHFLLLKAQEAIRRRCPVERNRKAKKLRRKRSVVYFGVGAISYPSLRLLFLLRRVEK